MIRTLPVEFHGTKIEKIISMTLNDKINIRSILARFNVYTPEQLIKASAKDFVFYWGRCLGFYPITQSANLIYGYRSRDGYKRMLWAPKKLVLKGE